MAENENKTELTLDLVKQFINSNEDAKKWLQSEKDSAVTKGVKTYEDNFTKEKLPKLLEDEISKRYPAETPEQKRLKELELKFTQSENEKKRALLQSSLLKKATEKNLPDFLVDFSLDEDEEKSTVKLLELGQKYQEYVNKEVENRLQGTGRKTPIVTGTSIENIDLNNLPDDPDWILKHADEIDNKIRERDKKL